MLWGTKNLIANKYYSVTVLTMIPIESSLAAKSFIGLYCSSMKIDEYLKYASTMYTTNLQLFVTKVDSHHYFDHIYHYVDSKFLVFSKWKVPTKHLILLQMVILQLSHTSTGIAPSFLFIRKLKHKKPYNNADLGFCLVLL